MSTKTTEHYPFIDYLERLKKNENRAALAALRRGLGQPAGSVASTYPYVVPWLPRDNPWAEDTYYLIASLYALHPASAAGGNMGDHMARTRSKDDIAVERRFTALLAAHPDDLPFYLRQAISWLRSKDVAVNWHQLMRDLSGWGHSERYVQRRWANAFWGAPETTEEETE